MSDFTRSGLLSDVQKALSAGNSEEAEKWCRLHLKSFPSDPAGMTMLAMVVAQRGRIGEAKELLTEALRSENSYEAHLALSTVLFAENELGEAVAHAEAAIACDPSETGTYVKTGKELVRKGRLDEAIGFFARAVDLRPDDVTLLQDWAAALKDRGQFAKSLEVWTRITELAPGFALGWLNRGMLQLQSHDFDGALESGEKAAGADKRNVDALILIALALQEKGLAYKAEPHLRKALEVAPSHPMVQASLGLSLQEQGRFADAHVWLRRSLERWPTNGLAYYTIARSQKISESDAPMLDQIERSLRSDRLGLLDRSYMEYALGKAYEDLSDYEVSMAHYDAANRAAYEFWFSESPWDARRYADNFKRTIETFTSEKISELQIGSDPSSMPVLIVGMIRSGTTLLEQIVSSHPHVTGAGELTYWHERAGHCFDPAACEVNETRLRETARGYLRLLSEVGSGAERVTDKLPHNYAVLGLVQSALPSSRIIHIRRNPLDNCLSVYTTGYQRPPGFTLDRMNIVFAYKQYRMLVAHWRSVLPADRFLEVEYEDLIANREKVTRGIIDFLGLRWDDRCLHHEANDRAVHTPSAWQVRQPIYRTSVERWRRFEPWIAPFDSLLAE